MPRLPKITDLATLVAALDRHPFGTLAAIVLATIALAVVWVLRH